MESIGINYVKLAMKLTLIYFLSTGLSTLLFILVTKSLHIYKPLFPVGLVITIIVGSYFCVGWFLRRNYKVWNITIIKEYGGERSFKGAPLVALFFGLYWRNVLVAVVTNALGAMLKLMYGTYLTTVISFSVDLGAGMLSTFVAFYWLLKVQYGSFRIVALNRSDAFRSVVIDENETVEDVKTGIKDMVVGVLGTTAMISYFALGLVQIIATYDFFRYYWHWNWFVSGLSAMFVGYAPIFGSVAGVIAATKVWGWDLWVAMLLFLYPFVIYIVILILGGTVSIFGSVFGNRK